MQIICRASPTGQDSEDLLNCDRKWLNWFWISTGSIATHQQNNIFIHLSTVEDICRPWVWFLRPSAASRLNCLRERGRGCLPPLCSSFSVTRNTHTHTSTDTLTHCVHPPGRMELIFPTYVLVSEHPHPQTDDILDPESFLQWCHLILQLTHFPHSFDPLVTFVMEWKSCPNKLGCFFFFWFRKKWTTSQCAQ